MAPISYVAISLPGSYCRKALPSASLGQEVSVHPRLLEHMLSRIK